MEVSATAKYVRVQPRKVRIVADEISGMPAAFALLIKVSAIAASAILKPPEAEPVIPAKAVTVTASFTSGFGIEPRAFATTKNPGSAAITAPKPYSDAVFIEASNAPLTAGLVLSANCAATLRQANNNTETMPKNQRALDRPNRGNFGDLLHHRCWRADR